MVLSMLIDHRGNFWIGSDLGLMRLVPAPSHAQSDNNSSEFKFEHIYRLYADQAPLLKTYILELLEDRNGIVWVSTALGLVRIDLSDSAKTDGFPPQIQYYPFEGTRYRGGGFLEINGKQGSRSPTGIMALPFLIPKTVRAAL